MNTKKLIAKINEDIETYGRLAESFHNRYMEIKKGTIAKVNLELAYEYEAKARALKTLIEEMEEEGLM